MSLDIHHYIGTFRRKPGALANSVALKAHARLKGVFDEHYSGNPREFVEVVATNPGIGPDGLADVLLAHSTCERTPASAAVSSRIAEQAIAQVARMSAIGRGMRHAG